MNSTMQLKLLKSRDKKDQGTFWLDMSTKAFHGCSGSSSGDVKESTDEQMSMFYSTLCVCVYTRVYPVIRLLPGDILLMGSKSNNYLQTLKSNKKYCVLCVNNIIVFLNQSIMSTLYIQCVG